MLSSLLRSRPRAVLAAGAVAAAAALALAGCGGSDDSGSEPGAAAGFIPAASPLYIEVSTDLSGAQWEQAETLLKNFPGAPEGGLRSLLRDELQSEGVDFDAEVAPLLGERAGIGARADAASGVPSSGDEVLEDADFIGVVELAEGKDGDAEALLNKNNELTPVGERAGSRVFRDSDGDHVAIGNGAIVISDTEATLNEALDAHAAGGDATLDGNDRFRDALAKLPEDVFAQAYFDIGTLAAQAVESQQQLQQLGGVGDIREAVLAAAITAEDDGVRLKGIIDGAEVAEGAAEFTPTLTERAPSDALAYIGFAQLNETVGQVVSQLREQGNEDVAQQLQAFSTQVPAFLGVTLDDLSALADGEHAVVVTGSPSIGVGAVLAVEDGSRATATLDKVRAASPNLLGTLGASPGAPPAWRQVQLGSGVGGWELAVSPEASVVYGVDGDSVLVGSSVAAVRQLQAPATPLSASPDFQAGTTGIPERVTGLLWLDVEQLIAVGEREGAFDQAEAEDLANLRPIRSVTGWTSGDGGTPTFEFFARIAG